MRNYRNEIKFIISKPVSKELKVKLRYLLDYDSNTNKEGWYIIRSLYFDDLQNTAFYEKLDGVLYRKKYRIRIYNDDENYIRLERKYKHNNLTSKDQILINKDIYSKILNGSIDDINISEDNLLTEFISDIKSSKLMPSVIVEYKRTAYTYPLSNIRITIDEKIKSGRYNYDLFDENIPKYNVLGEKELVLEVKYDHVLPSHIRELLETIPSYRQAVSKFAICREIK